MRVCVLLSTYNGEKFIVEQIESLLAQKDVEVNIVVRDDGSSDRTCEILDTYQNNGKLKWYTGNNLGFAQSFIDLVLQAPDSDYYAFCDQDDIWLSDKLSRAVNALETLDNPRSLYCSNVFYYKDGQTYGGIHKHEQTFDKYTCLVRNIAPGCSMVFTKGIKDLVKSAPPRKIIAHDFWIFQLAVLMGVVVYDFEPSMLYRQHENNQIGQKNSRKDIWKRRIKHLSSSRHNHDREEQAKELLFCYESEMADDTRTIVSRVAHYRNSLKNKFGLILDKRYTMGTPKADAFLKLRILFSKL